LLTFFVGVTQPKVNDFQGVVISQQDIFRFKVPVGDTDLVDVLNTIDNLMEKFSAFVFFDSLVFYNVVEKLAVFHVLHDE